MLAIKYGKRLHWLFYSLVLQFISILLKTLLFQCICHWKCKEWYFSYITSLYINNIQTGLSSFNMKNKQM